MIVISNKDGHIYNLEYKILDIVNEYQRNDSVTINTNYEGICLEFVGFYKLLDCMCDIFLIDKSKITIITENALESHSAYNIIIVQSHWLAYTKTYIPQGYAPTKNTHLRTLGCFVGKINWHRLVLLNWLYNNYQDQCLLTCHYRNEDNQTLQSELTELNFYMSSEIDSINFLKHCPLIIDEEFTTFTIMDPDHLTIIKQYDKIFLDLVIETYIMGNTFFPTEKTIRPIIAQTPFIIMGPKHYLANLKKLGFKTFDKWWSEDYDQFAGVDRIIEIKKRLSDIFSWQQEKLHTVLTEMQPILEFNYNHYMTSKLNDNKK